MLLGRPKNENEIKTEREKNSLERNISHFVFCGLLEVCSASACYPTAIPRSSQLLFLFSSFFPFFDFAIKSGPPKPREDRPRRRQEETNGKNNYIQFILFLPTVSLTTAHNNNNYDEKNFPLFINQNSSSSGRSLSFFVGVRWIPPASQSSLLRTWSREITYSMVMMMMLLM